MNSSNTTALGRFDGLHSQRQRTHQSKHALTENSEGLKNRRKRLKNCSCLFFQTPLAKFGRADKASKQENKTKQNYNNYRASYIFINEVIVRDKYTGSSLPFCTILE